MLEAIYLENLKQKETERERELSIWYNLVQLTEGTLLLLMIL